MSEPPTMICSTASSTTIELELGSNQTKSEITRTHSIITIDKNPKCTSQVTNNKITKDHYTKHPQNPHLSQIKTIKAPIIKLTTIPPSS